jgi:glycosyltransferase involved in cell wall biosynthesis
VTAIAGAAPRRLKIFVVAPSFPLTGDPVTGVYNFRKASALAEHADVEVFRLRPWLFPWRARPRRDVVDLPGERVKPLPVTQLRYPSLPVVARPWTARLAQRALENLFRQERPDLVLSFWLYPEGLAATRAGHAAGCPAVAVAIGSDLRLARSRAARRRVRRAMYEADQVITVSDELRSRALEMGADPHRVTTIRNGCNADVFRPSSRQEARQALGVPPDAELVVFVGRLIALKGVRELITAVRSLAPRRRALRVALLGDGPLRGEVQQLVREAGLSSVVSFVGSRPSREVARWLAASNLLCLPSHSEGCPNVVLEALACGRPVVASDVGGIPELVSAECSVLVAPRDEAGLAGALATALDRDWNEAGIAGRHSRGWGKVGGEIFSVCLRALDSAPRRKAAP